VEDLQKALIAVMFLNFLRMHPRVSYIMKYKACL
jgi:hypothetical protein